MVAIAMAEDGTCNTSLLAFAPPALALLCRCARGNSSSSSLVAGDGSDEAVAAAASTGDLGGEE